MDGPGPSDPPPEHPPRIGVFEPVALTDDHPRLARWVVIAVLAITVLVAKPWDPGDGPDGGAGDRGTIAPVAVASPDSGRPAPSASPEPADALIDVFCLDRGEWLVVSVERRRDRTFKVWRALEPAYGATGPDDPAIPVMPVVSDGILDLGWCAPTYGPERPSGDASVAAWRLGTRGATPMAIMPREGPDETASAFGALYAAPRRPLSSRSAIWPDGRYVFRHRTDDGAERWFTVEVVNRVAVVPAS